MIYGIGTDIVEPARIKKSLERFGDKFLKRVFTSNEQKYCAQKKEPWQNLAARFAAKEAFLKAFGTGLRGRMRWRDIEVVRNDLGKPSIKLSGYLKQQMDIKKISKIHLSLSHIEQTALGYVVIEHESSN